MDQEDAEWMNAPMGPKYCTKTHVGNWALTPHWAGRCESQAEPPARGCNRGEPGCVVDHTGPTDHYTPPARGNTCHCGSLDCEDCAPPAPGGGECQHKFHVRVCIACAASLDKQGVLTAPSSSAETPKEEGNFIHAPHHGCCRYWPDLHPTPDAQAVEKDEKEARRG